MAIVGVDIGNITSIAVCNDINVVVESRLEKATELNLLGADDSFKYENEKYITNSGRFENNFIKHEKENFLGLMYYAISRVTQENKIDLAIGLPAGQYNSRKTELKDFILNNNRKIIDNREIHIKDVIVIPEAYGVKTNGLISKTNKTLVIDVGGGTTDIALFENGKFKGEESRSIKFGLLDVYRETKNYIDDKYNLNITLEDAKKYFDGELDLLNKDTYYKVDIVKAALKKIINELRGLYANISSYNIVLTGGVATVLYQTFKKIYPQTEILDDIKANATGFYRVGVKKFE